MFILAKNGWESTVSVRKLKETEENWKEKWNYESKKWKKWKKIEFSLEGELRYFIRYWNNSGLGKNT